MHKPGITDIEQALAASQYGAPLALKLRVATIISYLSKRYKKPFGLLIILGWKDEWKKFAVTPDASQDIFAGDNIANTSRAERKNYHGLSTTILFDGAILIDRRGKVRHSGVMLEGLRPRETAAKLHPGKFSDLSMQFGFKEKVHTRHLTAITASYAFKGTTVFTISEETGRVHIFENGKIIYESSPGNVKRARAKAKK